MNSRNRQKFRLANKHDTQMKREMKKLIPLLALCLIACGGGGGDNDDDVTVGSERIEVPDVTILADGGEKQVTVNANCTWVIKVPDADTWLTINPMSGTNTQTITVSCTENKSNNSRTSVVTISGKQRTTAFKVTQNPPTVVILTIGNFNLGGLTSNSVDYSFSVTPPSNDISSCGVCLSTTNSNPTLDDTVSYGTRNDNMVNGAVTSLSTNTTYYVRAFATNSSSTYYSQVRQITTVNNVPGSDDNQPPS